MNLATIPLAAKVSVGAIGGLALLGGGLALGAHLGSGGAQASSSTAVVAPTPSASPSAAAKNNAAAQAVRRAALAAEAQVLGTTTKQLSADVRSGRTVQQLAAAKGLSQSQFQTQFQAALKTQLDREVTAGTVTQAEEQQALKRLTAAIPNWSQVPARKSPSPSPSATP
jgi:cell division septum initiation protein DivIVA